VNEPVAGIDKAAKRDKVHSSPSHFECASLYACTSRATEKQNVKNVIYLGPSESVDSARDVLEPTLNVVVPELTRASVAAQLPEAVGILDASMKINLDRSMLDQAPNLQAISTATTGADHIDAKILAERGVPLLTLAGEKEILHNLTPAAELSWALLMACCRQFRGALQHVMEGHWIREKFPGVMLKGKLLGLIGCGRIGSWMARYARAFDMDVIGYDPYADVVPDQIRKTELDELLSSADFVSVHVPLNEQTRGMLGRREFARIKPGAIFINTSRGAVTDEDALLTALVEGRLAAAGVDVLEGEPNIDLHPLVQYARTHDNLIITPHIGGFSPDAVKVAVRHASHRILNVLKAAN
jgi:D-3-phosphoglycerate dehydrogenase / 2-oxoglutarate reductase